MRNERSESGCYGVKLNGAQIGYPIDDPSLAVPVNKAIAEPGTVLALHGGAGAPDHTRPARVATIARAIPDPGILVEHMGARASTNSAPPSPSPRTIPT